MDTKKKIRKLVKNIVSETADPGYELKKIIRSNIKLWGEIGHSELIDIAYKYGVDVERVMEIYLHIMGELKEEKHREFVDAVKHTIEDARKDIDYTETLTWDKFFEVWTYEGYSDPEWFEDISVSDLKTEFENQTQNPNQMSLF